MAAMADKKTCFICILITSYYNYHNSWMAILVCAIMDRIKAIQCKSIGFTELITNSGCRENARKRATGE